MVAAQRAGLMVKQPGGTLPRTPIARREPAGLGTCVRRMRWSRRARVASSTAVSVVEALSQRRNEKQGEA